MTVMVSREGSVKGCGEAFSLYFLYFCSFTFSFVFVFLYLFPFFAMRIYSCVIKKKKRCSCLSVLALAVGLVPEWVMCKRPNSQRRWSLHCMEGTRSFSQVLASGRWLAEIGNSVRVTQRQCVSTTCRPWRKETRQAGGAQCSKGCFLAQARIQSWGKGEGGVVSQVVVAIGQQTKCKDLFSLEAKAKIRPRLDFSGSQ